MNYPLRKGYDELYDQYINKKMSIAQIAKLDNVTSTTVRKAMEHFKIAARVAIKTKQTKDVHTSKLNPKGFILSIGKDVLYDLYVVQKKSGVDIANMYNINSTLVYKALKYWNIDTKQKPFYEIIGKEGLIELYINQRMSMYDIAERFGIEPQKVLYAVDYWDIQKDSLIKLKDRTYKCHGYDLNDIPELYDKNWLQIQYETNTISQIATTLDVSSDMVLRAFKRYDLDCYRKTSSYEGLIVDFLKKNHICNIIQHDRTIVRPKEIDIFLPDYNLAIEINGEFWHSTKFPRNHKKSHQQKTQSCLSQNITLFQIWKHELDDKGTREIIFDKLSHMLHLTQNKIHARKCILREVHNCKHFFDINHIQGGYDLGNIRLGLFFEDQMVACMCFKHTSDRNYELTRFATINNTIVNGGFSKLFTFFKKTYNPSIVTSWSNGRFHKQDNVYITNGFVEHRWSDPNYFYINISTGELKSRQSCQKHKLSQLLPAYQNDVSEVQNMMNHNYYQVYDCGHVFYVFTVDSAKS